MTAKEYLSRVMFADMLINVKKKELTRLTQNITQMTSQTTNERVKTSNKTDFTKTADKIVDLQNEINNEIDSLIDLKCEIRKKINGLDDPIYISVLTDHYINYETFETIAEKTINCSGRWVRTLHGEALQAFSKKYNMK